MYKHNKNTLHNISTERFELDYITQYINQKI